MIGSVFDFEPILYAAGNGWQFIIVIREFNTVIVTTGHNYIEQEAKTTLSQHELIYSVLSCNSAFRKKINRIFNEDNRVESRNFYEILLMAQALNSQGEYTKSVSYLERVDTMYKNDLRFCYFIGEAYYHTGKKEKARTYLENCVRLCEEQQLPEAGYSRMAKNILAL
jgi:tetratricopeptide (TPR) repeat protein